MRTALKLFLNVIAFFWVVTANAQEYRGSVIMGADPRGISLKNAVKEALVDEGFEVIDITGDEQQASYDVGYNVGKAIAEHKYDYGFVFCGTGMGVNLVANKFDGVYCALCESIETARLSRVINNANVLAMGGLIVTPYIGQQMARTFVNTGFSKGFSEVPPEALIEGDQGRKLKIKEIMEYNENKQK